MTLSAIVVWSTTKLRRRLEVEAAERGVDLTTYAEDLIIRSLAGSKQGLRLSQTERARYSGFSSLGPARMESGIRYMQAAALPAAENRNSGP